MHEENQEIIIQDEIINQEVQEDVSVSENESESLEDESANDSESVEDVTLTTQTIIVDGQSVDFYSEVYRELKVSNFLLQTILVVIVVLFLVNKIYSWIRSILTVKF